MKNNNNYKITKFSVTIQKFRINRLLTKDHRETSSLQYILITIFTVSFLYYANTYFCVLTD